ncbi:FG-GAP repeat protein, partial [Candidatus Sumerlaeota bacterium]|nr:FG-GAP repeat protein [Candidatus Sumerlaeota bacterium]
EGKAFVYHGSREGLSPIANWDKGGDQESAWFGHSVGTAGDVNGDGYSDVIVGAPNYSTSAAAAGRVFVYHGSPSGLNTDFNWDEEISLGNSWFGWSVGTAGDINGDGYSDVIIGIPKLDAIDTDRGAVYIAEGSSSGLISPGLTLHGDSAGDEFGCSVGTAGDVNGDGYADVVIGAWLYTNGQSNEGKAYCIHGSDSLSGGAYDWTIEGSLANAGFGVCIASAGDVNGDGYADVIAGAPGFSNGETGEGGAFLFYGNGGRGDNLVPRQMCVNVDTPISLLGKSNHWSNFQISVWGNTPFGRGKARLEWEVKPLGTLFDGNNTYKTAVWVDTNTLFSEISVTAAAPDNQIPCHWRARLLYNPACVPFQQRSRWLAIPWNGWQEGDLRVSKTVRSFILY